MAHLHFRYGCDKTFLKKQKQQDHLVLHKVKEGDISEDMKKLCVECGKVGIFIKVRKLVR